MEVIEPGSVQRTERLLPGSAERRQLEVNSLQQLKDQLDHVNSKSNRRKRAINNAIIVASIASILGLVIFGQEKETVLENVKSGKIPGVNPGSSSAKPNSWTLKKTLRYIAMALSIGGLIRGIAKSDKLDVIEPDGTRQIPKYSEREPVREQTEEDKFRVMTVRATLDTLIASGVVSKESVKNRAKAHSFRKPDTVSKAVLKEIVKYGKSI